MSTNNCENRTTPIRFMFDVESQSLHGEGFGYGYVVTKQNEKTGEIEILEKGECYSVEGARGATQWVKENVLPYLHTSLIESLSVHKDKINIQSEEIVLTTEQLRQRFYEVYIRWKKQGAEFWSDVCFPVETNFLSAMIADDKQSREWDGPYPLKDVSAFVNVDVDRNEYSGLNDLKKHNPLDDSLASAFSLYKWEKQNN